MKVLYCIGSLTKPGGAERVLITKANYLSKLPGYEVTILVANQNAQPYAYDIANSVDVLDMKVNEYQHWLFNFPILGFFFKIKVLKKKYQKVINDINPDIVINVERGFEDFFLHNLNPGRISVRESHSSLKAVKMMSSTGKFSLKQKFFTRLYNKQLKKYDQVVLLTEEDRLTRNYKNGNTVIPNVIASFNTTADYNTKSKKVISVGRLDVFKNFQDQIMVWKDIVAMFPDWTLHIYGEGPDKINLQKMIVDLELQSNVFLEGRTSEVEKVLKEGALFLFTSKAEGFGMVLVEAMQMGLPVISYNCPCGPKDIISEGEDGYLVPLLNKEVLKDRIIKLIKNEPLRKEMSQKAIEKSRKFSEDVIMPQWIELFNRLKDA